jgi:hypothetical protein
MICQNRTALYAGLLFIVLLVLAGTAIWQALGM